MDCRSGAVVGPAACSLIGLSYLPILPFCFSSINSCLRLPLGRPDVLDKAVALCEAVKRIVGLTHGADKAAEGVDVVLAVDLAARLVNLGDGDLDGAVVLGLDDAVGGRALAGDVAVRREGRSQYMSLFCLCDRLLQRAQSSNDRPSTVAASHPSGWVSVLQVHDVAAVVLHFDVWIWEVDEGRL